MSSISEKIKEIESEVKTRKVTFLDGQDPKEQKYGLPSRYFESKVGKVETRVTYSQGRWRSKRRYHLSL